MSPIPHTSAFHGGGGGYSYCQNLGSSLAADLRWFSEQFISIVSVSTLSIVESIRIDV